MRDRRKLAASRQIAAIRAIQQRAAEQRLVEANTAMREATERRDEGERELGRQEQAWADHIALGRFEPAIAGAWAASVNAQVETLVELDGEVAGKREQADRSTADYQASLARADAARDVVRTTGRRVRRLEEENALGDVAERHAQRPRS